MELFALIFVTIDVHIGYSVIDSNRVETAKSLNATTRQQPPWIFAKNTLICFLHSWHLFIYEIVIKKMDTISLKLKGEDDAKFEVFDGPGVLSTAINPQYVQGFHQYTTSTFQCLIHALVFKRHPIYLHFLEHSHNKFSTSFVNSTSPVYFSHKEQAKRDIHIETCRLETHSALYLKLIVLDFVFEGDISTKCTFGGATLYHWTNYTWTELSSLCRTQDETFQHKQIFSSSNSVIIVYYSYQAYMKALSFNFSVLSTECEGVVVNVCDYDVLDGTDDLGTIVVIFGPPHKFRISVESNNHFLLVSILGDNCKVLQLFAETEEPIRYCFTRIVPVIPQEGTSVQLNVTGFFRSFYHKDYFDLPMIRGMVKQCSFFDKWQKGEILDSFYCVGDFIFYIWQGIWFPWHIRTKYFPCDCLGSQLSIELKLSFHFEQKCSHSILKQLDTGTNYMGMVIPSLQ